MYIYIYIYIMLCVYILAGMLNLKGYKIAILAIESLLAQVFPRS
jgi:hypothetical protein